MEYFSFSLIDPDAPQLQAPLPVFVQQAAAAKMIGCGKLLIVVVYILNVGDGLRVRVEKGTVDKFPAS